MMGVFRVPVRLFALEDPSAFRELEMVVDTGATFSVVPGDLCRQLGIRALRERTLTLADGRQIDRALGWAGLAYGDESTPTWVVFGEPGEPPLLGAHALEGMGLEVDPNRGELRPATLYLLAA